MNEPEARQTSGDQSAPTVWPYLNVVLRRRWFIVGVAMACGLLVGLFTYLGPRYYTAVAKFLPQESSSTQSGGLMHLATQFGFVSPRASTTSPQFYANLLTSREVMRSVVTTEYSLPEGARGDLVTHYRIKARDRDEAVRYAIRRLNGNLEVMLDRPTGVVAFSVATRSPELSLQVSQRFLELINEYNLQRRQSQARTEREFVSQRLTEAERELATAEDSLTAFLRRNRSFATVPELSAEEGRLQRKVSLRQQIFVSLSQSHEAAKLDEVRDTPVITVLEHPTGFVEPRPRGTIRRTMVASMVGLVLSIVIAFAGVAVRRAKGTAPDHYREFQALRAEAARDVRRLLTLKTSRSS